MSGLSTRQNAETNPLSVALPIAYPLDDFYAQAGLPLPPIEAVTESQIPEPYRSLLVHKNDMTPTLETFHQDTIHLQVLREQQREEVYFREVVLLLDKTGKPVEFGAIKINLFLLKPLPRKLILEGKLPLGHIMREHHVRHSSRPKAYLRIVPDSLVGDALKLTDQTPLYGRRNTLFDPQLHPLAEIVEILPP